MKSRHRDGDKGSNLKYKHNQSYPIECLQLSSHINHRLIKALYPPALQSIRLTRPKNPFQEVCLNMTLLL